MNSYQHSVAGIIGNTDLTSVERFNKIKAIVAKYTVPDKYGRYSVFGIHLEEREVKGTKLVIRVVKLDGKVVLDATERKA